MKFLVNMVQVIACRLLFLSVLEIYDNFIF